MRDPNPKVDGLIKLRPMAFDHGDKMNTKKVT